MSRLQRLISTVRDAFAGKEEDYTSGSLNRAIVLLSVPMIMEMLMESLFAVVDIFFVGKVSVNAVATVGLTESMLTLVYSLAFGMAMAVTAMVARRIGEKNIEEANRAAMQGIWMGVLIATFVSVIGIFFSQDLLRFMGASPTLVRDGATYTRIMLATNYVIMLLFINNAIFRGAGNAVLAMRALWIANGLNMLLDPLLIFGWGPIPAMGLTGAAIATTIGRSIGVIYQLYHMFDGKGLIKIARRHMVLGWDIIKKLLDVSAGGAGQFLIASASWVFLMRIVAEFGEAALAGYTIGIRVLLFTIFPAWGMANAAATLVGQNLGAGQPERAELSVWKTARYDMVFLGLVSLVYLIFAPQIVRIFTQDSEVFPYAVQCLQIMALGYVFFAYGMVIAQAFNGAGDTRTPTWMNLICFWLIEIPLAYTLAKLVGLGPKGVFFAVIIAEAVLAGLAIYMFRKGKWKDTKI